MAQEPHTSQSSGETKLTMEEAMIIVLVDLRTDVMRLSAPHRRIDGIPAQWPAVLNEARKMLNPRLDEILKRFDQPGD